MGYASPSPRNRSPPRRTFRSRGRGRRRSRGVSDVIATIIILGITVTLFASLFAFVDSFPAPPSQSVNTFETTLSYTVASGKTYISTIAVEMTAGPAVPGVADVFLSSENNPGLAAFAAPITVSYGIHNASDWVVGETWMYNFPAASRDLMPDNITVSIVSASLLLYSVVVPGNVPSLPPTITASGATPNPVAVGAAFQIYAVFSGNLTGAVSSVNIGGIPGLSGTQSMASYNGMYVYNVTAGKTTTAGTYYAFLSLTNGQGQQTSGSVTVVLTSSSSGGSGAGLSVAVGMSPQPPTLPQQSPSAYFWAAVTYSGTKTNVPVSVNFTITQVPGGRSSTLIVTNIIPGQTGLTITGPSTLTVYSQTADNFNSWLLNTSVTVSATATLGQSVGSANGTITFQTQNLIVGQVYVTTSSAGSMANQEHSFPHYAGGTCGGSSSNCPYIFAEIWDNFTAALGGPATVTVSGVAWANTTSGTVHDFEIPTTGIGSTTVTQTTSPLLLNLNGGTTRENEITSASASGYTLAMWLTVRSTATGTPIIGYIYDTFPITSVT